MKNFDPAKATTERKFIKMWAPRDENYRRLQDVNLRWGVLNEKYYSNPETPIEKGYESWSEPDREEAKKLMDTSVYIEHQVFSEAIDAYVNYNAMSKKL